MAARLTARWLAAMAGVLLLFAVLGSVAEAQSPNPPNVPEPVLLYDEAEAQAIDQRIMCPVCPAETIDQAQVPVARQMRQLVRQKLSEGSDREEILSFFAQRYGPDILALPPKSGFNLIAWVFPIVVVAGALIAGVFVLRSMKSSRPMTATAVPRVDSSLDPYLALVDRELSRMQSNSQGKSTPASASDAALGDVRPSGEGGPESNV